MSVLIMCLSVAALAIEDGFRNPPDSAKPHAWYQMMNGKVTKEGITRGIEGAFRQQTGGMDTRSGNSRAEHI